MITIPWSRLRRWQGLRVLSAFMNPRTAILSAFPIQKTRRRLLTTTKRVCVIWKTISGSTRLPLILRRASARHFFIVLVGRKKTIGWIRLLFKLNADISVVTAQPQPSSKNKAGAKPGSSKLQIFFLQTSGSLSDHGSRSFKNARSFGSCSRP